MKCLVTCCVLTLMAFSGCSQLVLKDDDEPIHTTAKVTSRVIIGLVTIGLSELLMARETRNYCYTRNLELAIQRRASKDDFAKTWGSPSARTTLSDGGEVWTYIEYWGSGTIVYVPPQGGLATGGSIPHGRKTILTFDNNGTLTSFRWNSW